MQGHILPPPYPIGSIFTSLTEINPANLFGGTWERLKDRFLLAAGDNFVAGSSGGEAEVILDITQIPSHQHETPLFSNGADIPSSYGIFGKGNVLSSYSPSSSYCEYYMTDGNMVGEKNEYALLTNAIGGSQAHDNMPPYLVVYMYKRIG